VFFYFLVEGYGVWTPGRFFFIGGGFFFMESMLGDLLACMGLLFWGNLVFTAVFLI